jgi:uncharacterized repeat protein (TIGR01451 family)
MSIKNLGPSHPNPGRTLRKLGLIALMTALAAVAVIGCGEDDPKPAITRLFASAECGVAPLRVDFRADATGGASLPDPTGGNNWLRMSWDFGDGTVIQDGTSIAYHEYDTTGTFTVTVTAEDDDGERATRSTEIVVREDSLSIEIYGLLDDMPVSEVVACRPLQLGILAETCDFDPVEDSYERFVFRWMVGDSTYSSPNPRHSFSSADVGQEEVIVRVEDPTRSITRLDTLLVDVLDSDGADVSLSTDWANAPQGADTDTLARDVPSWPDTLVYTVRVQNAGPDEAYNLKVVGNIDLNNRIFFESADYDESLGDFRYVVAEGGSTVKRWTWTIERIPGGAEESIDINFYVETANAGAVRRFFSQLDAYPCDPDTTDRRGTAVLNIVTVPPPPAP